MSQIVVDTDVASYIFNWHSLAQRYADVLRGSELVLSFMSVAELRMGAISAGWGTADGFSLSDSCEASNGFTRTTIYARFGEKFAPMRGQPGRALSPQDAWIAATALALPLATNNRRHYEHVEKLRLVPL
jgi:tRNA(fMet)-specific endonuclease VapC